MKYSNVLGMYYEASEILCTCFYQKYYWDESDGEYYPRKDDFYMIGDMKSQGIDTVGIGDQFWDLTDIQTALINNIERDILWEWYDKYSNRVNYPEQYMNLWHFYLKSKNKPMYTQDEIEESKKSVNKAQEIFENEMKKYITK